MGDLASGGIIIILFIVGIVLVFAELLMPTVIFGMIGAGCVIVAVVMAFITQPETSLGVWLLVTALVVFPIVVLLWIKLMGRFLSVKGTEADYDSSEAGIDELLGQEGVTLTMLRPAGIARFGDRRVDVVADGEIIEKDTRVEVTEVSGNRVVVRARRL